jgi:tetratricopeptide (TPR) repeat protein
VHNQRGRELLYQGHYQPAIDELTSAIEAQPGFALAYNARGFAYHMMRDTAHALSDLDEAIRLNPAYANAYHNRSVARKAAGDKDGSAADEVKSLELSAKK